MQLRAWAGGPCAASWAVLGLALLLIGLSLVQALYRLSLPGDGWSMRRDATGTGLPLVFDKNLAGEPSSLQEGDVLLAVEGRPADDILARALTLDPQRPPGWSAGESAHYTVQRGSEVLAVAVPLTTLTPAQVWSGVVRTLLMDPSLLPALLIALFVFFRQPRSAASRLLLLLCAGFFASDGISQSVTGSNIVGLAELFSRGAFWPAQFFNTQIWPLLIAPVYIYLFLTFPVEKEPVRRHPRLTLVVLFGLMPAMALLAVALSSGRPLAFWRTWGAFNFIDLVLAVAVTILAAGHTLLTVRDATRRAQIQWIAWGAIVTSIGVLSGGLLAAWGILGRNPLIDLLAFRFLFLAFPVSVAIAILRYRLFDIDIVVRRTLVYGVLSGMLVSVYFVSVILLQQLFRVLTGQQQTEPATVISTLAIATLFVPLRARVQETIDRRFYRRKYDAAKTLAAFSATAGDDVNLGQLVDQLLAVVTDTMQPAHSSLWLTSRLLEAPHPLRPEVRFVDVAPGDPLLAPLVGHRSPLEIDGLNLASPLLKSLRAEDVKLVVPLVNQGELSGLLNLGARLDERPYSRDDRELLGNLAQQAATALRVSQLVQQGQSEALELERVEQEMRVARLIQHTLLPKQVPEIPGWRLAVHYQPARAVGGDFYDFFVRPDGKLVLVVGDVTDKGVPAALVMATMRAILRGAARRMVTPGIALERSNNLLCPEIPENMFVTCLYAILDPASGHLQYANAGHDLPIRRSGAEVVELRATGMPLGLLPGMQYEEKEGHLAPGDRLLLYSDGLVEAHNAAREMFGFPHLRQLMAACEDSALIECLLRELRSFTGPNWEQEDDVTLVTLERAAAAERAAVDSAGPEGAVEAPVESPWRKLVEFSVPSEPGREIDAMNTVGDAAQELGLPAARIGRLKTAVAEATMNAMEHGNHFKCELPVLIRVLASPAALAVRITDQGGGAAIPEPRMPDLEAKVAGQETARGWGLPLIQKLVDEMQTSGDVHQHTLQLVMHLEGDKDAGKPA